MIIEENIQAKNLSTFKVGGTIRYFCGVSDLKDLEEAIAFAERKKVPVVVIGIGSNTLWKDTDHEILVIKFVSKEIKKESEDEDSVVLSVDAGLDWDNLVEYAVKEKYYGIESMSGIPGTVGASPVQNIGAYGREIKDVLVSVKVYDLNEKKVKILSNSDCGFSYRNSIFKGKGKGKFIILSITIKLFKKPQIGKLYESLQKFLNDKKIINPSLSDIRSAVLEIRSSKLPDFSKMPNCGSFFENPIVDINFAEDLKKKYPDLKTFKTENEKQVKIPAGWLIEKAGFKGKEIGKISVYGNNALVLINNGGADFNDLESAKNQITDKIKEMFGLELEMEPNVF